MSEPRLEDDIELIDYLRVLWRRRWLILLGTALAVAAAGIVSLFLPPLYETSSQLRIGRIWDEPIDNPYLTAELIGSEAFLAQVIGRLDLKITPYELKKSKRIEARVIEGGPGGQKLPLLLSVQARSDDPQEAVDMNNVVARLLIEEHLRRFDEKIGEYRAYEEGLAREVGRIGKQIDDLERMVQKQQRNPSVNAPSIILLQGQLEEKNAQLLEFRKELKDTRVQNASSIVTENSKLIAPPVLPRDPINPKVKLNMVVAGVLALFMTTILAFLLEYLHQVRIREDKGEGADRPRPGA